MNITDDMINGELERTNKAIEQEILKTQLKKADFIRQIKYGLGDDIKAKPNEIKIIKKPWNERFKIFLSKFFTKF